MTKTKKLTTRQVAAANATLTASGWEPHLIVSSARANEDGFTEFGAQYRRGKDTFWLNFKTIDSLPVDVVQDTDAETKRLEALVKKLAPRVWDAIAADAGDCDLESMVELVLDADRPVTFGGMTQADYNALIALDKGVVDGWAAAALRGLARR